MYNHFYMQFGLISQSTNSMMKKILGPLAADDIPGSTMAARKDSSFNFDLKGISSACCKKDANCTSNYKKMVNEGIRLSIESKKQNQQFEQAKRKAIDDRANVVSNLQDEMTLMRNMYRSDVNELQSKIESLTQERDTLTKNIEQIREESKNENESFDFISVEDDQQIDSCAKNDRVKKPIQVNEKNLDPGEQVS
jgi:hypothetical protein